MAERPNIVILAVDTLRADHLGCYGYRLPTSPNIDALAHQGVVAEHLICPAIPTWPSFTTLYTGQHPLTHGIIQHGGKAQLGREAPHLMTNLLHAGYTTCAVDNLMRERMWFGRGYEYYIDPGMRRILSLSVTCEQLNARALPWLREHRDESFALTIHYWDPHAPYTPPQRYNTLFYDGDAPTDPDNHSLDAMWKHPNGALARETWLRTRKGVVTDADYVRALYDREIRYLDDGVGQIVATLDELGLSENTLLILMADHGESMTEHGIFFDHYGLYESTIHVPFVARWPGQLRAGVRIPNMVRHNDIAPTLLDAAEISVPEGMEGVSFWPLLTGATTAGGCERVISMESTWQAKWSVRTDRHKFILARETDYHNTPLRELYDLEVDPQETHNLAIEQPHLLAEFERDFEIWLTGRLSTLEQSEDPLIRDGALFRSAWEKQEEQ